MSEYDSKPIVLPVAWDGADRTGSEDFDMEAVYKNLDGEQSQPEDKDSLLQAFKNMLAWICQGVNDKSRSIRLQTVRYYMGELNQVELAKQIGVKKATISQKAVEFRDKFKIDRPAGAASQMRSEEARKTFRKVCKSNHQKRKALSGSTPSQAKSTKNTDKQRDLRARVLNLAMQQS